MNKSGKRRRRQLPETRTYLASAQETQPSLPVVIIPEVDRSHWYLFGAALFSGLLLCIPLLQPLPLVLDEYGTFWIMSNANPLTMFERSLNYENIPPLSPYINSIFFNLLGQGEFAFRSQLLLWYLLTIGAVYLLGRSLLGAFPASVAAVACAWHQNVLGETRITRCYGLGLLLATLAFWATVQWGRSPINRRWAVFWTLLNCALLWTHYLNLLVTLAQLVVLVPAFYRNDVRLWNRLLWALAAYGFAALPLIKPLFRMSEWGRAFDYQEAEPLLKILTPLWWLGVPLALLVGYLLTRSGSGREVDQTSRQSWQLLLLWGFAPLLTAWLVGQLGFDSLSNPRYRIGFAGPACCLIAALLTHRRTRVVAVSTLLIALTASWAVAPRMPWDLKRLGSERSYEWRDMALKIEQQGQAEEPIYVQSGMGEGFLVPYMYLDPVFLDYAACRLGRFYCTTPHPRIGLPFLWSAGDDMVEHYEELLKGDAQAHNRTIWLAGATDTDLNRASVEGFHYLAKQAGFQEIDRVDYKHAVLIRYRHANQ